MSFTSIWLTVGSTGSAWTVRCQITRRSLRTHTVASEKAISSAACSRTSCTVASRNGWSEVMDLRVDASLIKADANLQKGIEGDKGLPPEGQAER